jgi:hypothetical protein
MCMLSNIHMADERANLSFREPPMGRSQVSGLSASRRLLTKAQAAAYCGLSIAAFTKLCPVHPISFGADKRLERFDVLVLNEWIDCLATCAEKCGRDWLDTMDADDD